MNWEKLAKAAADAGYPPEFTQVIKDNWSTEPNKQMWDLMGALTAVGLHVVGGSTSARGCSNLFRILSEAYVAAYNNQIC